MAFRNSHQLRTKTHSGTKGNHCRRHGLQVRACRFHPARLVRGAAPVAALKGIAARVNLGTTKALPAGRGPSARVGNSVSANALKRRASPLRPPLLGCARIMGTEQERSEL